mmetsp:Transcript_11473/g.21457  ORF Transcript_11473/g.21457 Transcript_11473/m.21457 type:complete len:123 (+) Transcript_11473:467-835(+)
MYIQVIIKCANIITYKKSRVDLEIIFSLLIFGSCPTSKTSVWLDESHSLAVSINVQERSPILPVDCPRIHNQLWKKSKSWVARVLETKTLFRMDEEDFVSIRPINFETLNIFCERYDSCAHI